LKAQIGAAVTVNASHTRRALGQETVERIGSVWGIGPDGELSDMFKRTPQEGLAMPHQPEVYGRADQGDGIRDTRPARRRVNAQEGRRCRKASRLLN
jgi:hypothetical protein